MLLFFHLKPYDNCNDGEKAPKKTLVFVCVYYYRPISIENFARVCMRTLMWVNVERWTSVWCMNIKWTHSILRPCFIASLSLTVHSFLFLFWLSASVCLQQSQETYTEKTKTGISTQVSAYRIAHVLVFLQIVLFRHRFQSLLACKPLHKHAQFNTIFYIYEHTDWPKRIEWMWVCWFGSFIFIKRI